MSPTRSGTETELRDSTENSEVSYQGRLSWRPFPVEALPSGCRVFALESARARGLDVSYVAVPMLAALAGAIGNRRRLRVKRSYSEPAILWAVIVARSGVGKSSPLDDVLAPLRDEERRLAEENLATLEIHSRALARHEAERAEYRKRAHKDPTALAPLHPADPPMRALLVEDVTVEALAERLHDNPRGLLLARDELSGWIASFDAYKNARGADAAHYLSMHRAGTLKVDRKDRRQPTIHVPRASLSIVGTVQPRIFGRLVRSEHRENGLLARLLVCMPDETVPQWSDADVSPAAYGAWETVLGSLLQLLDEDAELALTLEALDTYKRYHDRVAREGARESDDLYAALAKLRGGALRVALVLALTRAAERGSVSDLAEVDLEAMEAGIAIAEWFVHEARRVYAVLLPDGERSGDEHPEQRLLDAIRGRGRRITAAELARSSLARYRGDTEAAERALRMLVSKGHGSWEDAGPGPDGGRPTQRFVLAGYETPESGPKDESFGSGSRHGALRPTCRTHGCQLVRNGPNDPWWCRECAGVAR
jgi:hypothetical protein